MARERVLAGGGNAVDAAVATLFALTLVEPMMVGIFGAGMTHLRLADGTHMAMDPLQHGARRGAAGPVPARLRHLVRLSEG